MATQTVTDLACPFCGLACDDLSLEIGPQGVTPVKGACPRAQRAYARVGATPAAGAPQAWVAGAPASLDAAVAEATRLLAEAQAPVFGGLATDVLAMRGLMALADRTGALLDHMNTEAKMRNLRSVQDQGWISTTLSEVRNRADLLVVFGSDVGTRFPRFFERCLWVDETMFAPPAGERQLVFIGPPAFASAGAAPGGRTPEVIDIAPERLAEAAALLRGCAAGTLPPAVQTDLPLEALRGLVERLRAARYGVIVWAAPDLSWPHADLTVQALTATIGILSAQSRVVGLPLGGSDGDFSTDAVLLWQTGYPFRTSLGSGTGRYDPVMNSAERVLSSGEADCLLWVSTFDPERGPPASARCPVIALSCVGAPVLPAAEVQIMVATPGIDAAGYLYRADKVVTLPLRATVDRQLPQVGQLALRILNGLGASSC